MGAMDKRRGMAAGRVGWDRTHRCAGALALGTPIVELRLPRVAVRSVA